MSTLLLQETLENDNIISLSEDWDDIRHASTFIVTLSGRDENWTETFDNEDDAGELVADLLFDDLLDR